MVSKIASLSDSEITTNPHILLHDQFDPKLIGVNGVKLGSGYKDIELRDVVGTHVIDCAQDELNFAESLTMFEDPQF